MDLRPSVDELFRRLHKDSIQRSIRRAEREQLTYETGNSEGLVNEFYNLVVITRRRHRLLPQPRAWFRNLVRNMGLAAQIRMARKDGIPIAAIFTLTYRTCVVYKYGCSDARFHTLGGMPFLLWRLIEESKAAGAEKLDLGRSDLDHESLIRFKDKFGASRKSLTYYRYTDPDYRGKTQGSWNSAPLRRLFCSLPDAAFSRAGSILYRHMG
ncbi:MAG: GNAT family N-acetyltransferase [Terriglobales bacterium]